MIEYKEKIFQNYLSVLVDRTFKILPLYEEKNEGLFRYIQSMIYELYGLQSVVVKLGSDSDFIMLLSTFESLSEDALLFDGNDDMVKRETFKCINAIKRIEDKATGKRGL